MENLEEEQRNAENVDENRGNVENLETETGNTEAGTTSEDAEARFNVQNITFGKGETSSDRSPVSDIAVTVLRDTDEVLIATRREFDHEMRRSSWPLDALKQNGRRSSERRLSILARDYEPNPDVNVLPFRRSHPSPRGSVSRTANMRSTHEYVPPDGGWGWVCVCGAFVNYFLVVGLTRSFGVIYGELRETFPENSHSQIAAVPSIISTLVIGLTVLAGALSKRFSCRNVAFFGGFLCACSICSCYFTNSLLYLLVCFIFAGIGASLTTTPGILTIALYFRRKRAFATSLCLSGTAIGSMVQPPFLQFLSRKFGFRVALLTLGILMFFTCISALSFTDPQKAFQQQRKRHLQENDLSSYPLVSAHSQSTIFVDHQPEPLVDVQPSRATTTTPSSDQRQVDRDEDGLNPIQLMAYDMDFVADMKTNEFDRDLLDVASRRYSDEETQDEPVDAPLLSGTSSGITSTSRAQTRANDIEKREPLSDTQRSFHPSDSEDQIIRQPIVAGRQGQYYSSKLSIARESSSSLLLLQFRNHVEARYSIMEQSPRNKVVLWIKQNLYVDITFFKNSVFLVVFFSTSLMLTVYPTGLIFIPIYSINRDVEESLASILLSVAAAGDLVGRIICGLVLDRRFIPSHYALIVSLVFVGASYLILIADNNYWFLATFVCIYGIAGGFAVLTIPILLADHHGANSLSSTYGLSRIGQAFIGIATPPIAGYLRDLTGTFMFSFLFMGSCTILGGTIAMFIPFVKHKYRSKAVRLSNTRRAERSRALATRSPQN